MKTPVLNEPIDHAANTSKSANIPLTPDPSDIIAYTHCLAVTSD